MQSSRDRMRGELFRSHVKEYLPLYLEGVALAAFRGSAQEQLGGQGINYPIYMLTRKRRELASFQD